MMLAQFKPIANGTYIPADIAAAGGEAPANATAAAAYVLDEYFNYENGEFGVYKSYWTSVYYLLAIFVLFRVLVVVSLVVQDTKFGEAAGDTRW
jgi:hypothetical protein